jgi:hypothetical protein
MLTCKTRYNLYGLLLCEGQPSHTRSLIERGSLASVIWLWFFFLLFVSRTLGICWQPITTKYGGDMAQQTLGENIVSIIRFDDMWWMWRDVSIPVDVHGLLKILSPNGILLDRMAATLPAVPTGCPVSLPVGAGRTACRLSRSLHITCWSVSRVRLVSKYDMPPKQIPVNFCSASRNTLRLFCSSKYFYKKVRYATQTNSS